MSGLSRGRPVTTVLRQLTTWRLVGHSTLSTWCSELDKSEKMKKKQGEKSVLRVDQ